MTDLGMLPGGRFSVATAINPAGEVVGWSETAARDRHAFRWKKGAMTDLGTLGGSSSLANGINPAGRVVGISSTADGSSHAFLWEKGMMTDLGDTFEPTGINPAGQVVGYGFSQTAADYRAILWSKGVRTDLGTLGGNRGIASAINPTGQVVGSSRTLAGDIHATLWTRK